MNQVEGRQEQHRDPPNPTGAPAGGEGAGGAGSKALDFLAANPIITAVTIENVLLAARRNV